MQTQQFALHANVEDRHWWFVARRRIMTRLVRAVLPPGQGGIVMDVGCGTGANIASLMGEYICVGADSSAEAVAWCRRRFPGLRVEQGHVPPVLADVAHKAELILLMDVIEHVRDDFLLLSEILAVARPGAHVLVTVPADASLWSPHDVAFGHYRRYDAQRLAATWAGLPVTTRLLSHFNSRLYPLVKAARAAARRRGRARGEDGTDFTVPSPPVNALLRLAFEGEGRRLERQLRGGRGPGPRHGVSLIALLRREQGDLRPRHKPAGLPSDLFDPEAPRHQ